MEKPIYPPILVIGNDPYNPTSGQIFVIYSPPQSPPLRRTLTSVGNIHVVFWALIPASLLASIGVGNFYELSPAH